MRILSVLLLIGCGLATADTFLIKSTDGGRTWTDIDPGPPYQLLDSFNVDAGASALYALTQTDLGAEARLLVSADGGQTWEARQNLPSAFFRSFLAAGSPDTLYLAQEDGAGYPRSAIITKVTNGGRTVEQYRAEGLTIVQGTVPGSFGGYLTRLAVAPPSRLYALTTNEYADDLFVFFQALWVSTDGGRNWRRLEPPVSPNCTYPAIWIDPSDSSVYLACGTSEFLKSTDGGESWTRKPTPDEGRVWNLQTGPGAPAILYTVVSNSGSTIWRSTDGAEAWQRAGDLPKAVHRLQVHPTNPSVIFGAGDDGVWKSENGGETWTKLAEYGASFEIQVDPGAPDTLYGWSFQRQQPRLHDWQVFLRNLLGEKQVAPGGMVSIYGRDLARETHVAGSTPLPASLGGASIFFNGQPAPLLFVSPDQINAQVPFGLAPVTGAFPPTTSVIMEVRGTDGILDRQTVSLSPRAVVILRENWTRRSAPLLFHASDFRPVTADDRAHRGEAITLLAVGMGELEPSITSGAVPPTPPPQLPNPPCVVFSERPLSGLMPAVLAAAPAMSAGAAPGLIGVYQVTLEVPASLSAGSYTLSLTERRAGDLPGRECRIGYQGNQLDSVTLEVR